MVFVEFTSSNFPEPGAKHHFVGASLQDVLNDTAGGTEFGFAKFSSYREVDEAEARALGLGFLDEGIAAVQEGCKSYMLTTPRDVEKPNPISLTPCDSCLRRDNCPGPC